MHPIFSSYFNLNLSHACKRPKKTLKASAAEIPITTSMWLFGFSPTKPRNLWIIGAILLVILLTIILKKWAIYLEAQAHKCSMEKAQRNCENYLQISNLCCTGVIRTYALEELKMATTDFRIRIGVGATSFVYLAELGDGRLGAVKRVMEERGGSKKMFLDEVSVLLRISHPNLVGLMGFCLEKGKPKEHRKLESPHFWVLLSLEYTNMYGYMRASLTILS